MYCKVSLSCPEEETPDQFRIALTCLQAAKLMALFPMVHSLDCTRVQPAVNTKTMKILARLPKLQELTVEGDERTGNAVLAEVAKATGLTCLHLHSVEVSPSANINDLKHHCKFALARRLLRVKDSCPESFM